MLTILVGMLLNGVHDDLQKNNNSEQTSKIDKNFAVPTGRLSFCFFPDLVAATNGTMSSTRISLVITTNLMHMVSTDGLWITALTCTIQHNHICHKGARLMAPAILQLLGQISQIRTNGLIPN